MPCFGAAVVDGLLDGGGGERGAVGFGTGVVGVDGGGGRGSGESEGEEAYSADHTWCLSVEGVDPLPPLSCKVSRTKELALGCA